MGILNVCARRKLLTLVVLIVVAYLFTLMPWREMARSQGDSSITFTVNTVNDTVDANPGDGQCADSSGACSLRAAVMEANALIGAEASTVNEVEIVVPQGTYTLTIEGAPSDVLDPSEDQATGDLDIYTPNRSGVFRLRGEGAGTIIRGTGDRVINVENAPMVGSAGFSPTFSGGGPSFIDRFAGAVDGSSRAYAQSEGWFRVEILNLTVAEGFASVQVTPPISSRPGGGIRVHRESGGKTVIRGVVVRNNKALVGGGIYTVGDTEIEDTVIRDNEATSAAIPEGSGVSCHNLGPPRAGGIDASSGWAGGQPKLKRVLIAYNKATTIGGDTCDLPALTGGLSFGSGDLENVTVFGNSSNGRGPGGVDIYAARARHITVVGNSAQDDSGSGGVYLGNFSSLIASVVTGNINEGGPSDCVFQGEPETITTQFNILGIWGDCPHSPDDQLGVTDARLAPLGDYGGPTLTMLPLADSPVLDFVPTNACAQEDQRGVPRPQGDACDAGAVERRATETPAAPTNLRAVPGDGAISLTWDPVEGASSYNVYLAQEAGVTKENYQSKPGGARITGILNPLYQVSGLQNGVTYYFVVTAVNETGESPESEEVSATPQGGTLSLRLVNPPGAAIIGIPFGLSLQVVGQDGSPVPTFQGEGRLRIMGARLRDAEPTTGALPFQIRDGVASIPVLIQDAPLGNVSMAITVEGDQVAGLTREIVISRILATNDEVRLPASLWPYRVPAPGAGRADTEEHRFLRVRIQAINLPGGCNVLLTGSPDGSGVPEVDDTVYVVSLPGGQSRQFTPPGGPVPLLSAEHPWADVLLLSLEGNTYGARETYLTAAPNCRAEVRGHVVYDRNALPGVRVALEPLGGSPVAGRPFEVAVSLDTLMDVTSLSLELVVYGVIGDVTVEGEAGLEMSQLFASSLSPHGQKKAYYLHAYGRRIEDGAPLMRLRLRPVGGSLTIEATVLSATTGLHELRGLSTSLRLVAGPSSEVFVESVDARYGASSRLDLILRGWGLVSIGSLSLVGSETTAVADVLVERPGSLVARFNNPPPIGIYQLRLSGSAGPLEVRGQGQVAVPPNLAYVQVEVGRCALTIVPARPTFSDIVVRNRGLSDATVLMLVVVEPWVQNPQLMPPMYTCNPSASPAMPEVVLWPNDLRPGPKEERGFLVRLDVPAGQAREFWVWRTLSQQAVNEGHVTLGTRVVPINVRVIGYAPMGAGAGMPCTANDCPMLLQLLKEGWLRYVEATGYLNAMGRERGQAYLDLLGQQFPEMAEALILGHLGQVGDEMDKTASEALGREVQVYGEGPTIINSVAPNVVQGITNFLRDNADVFNPQVYLDTLKFTIQGFTDGTNAKYLTALADATVTQFSFGLVNPNWEPVYADAPYMEYARGVGTATGVAYSYYLSGSVIKGAGTVLNGAGKLFFTKVVGQPALPLRIGDMRMLLGYSSERGMYLRASIGEARLFLGAVNKAPTLNAQWSKLVHIRLDLSARTPKGALLAIVRTCIMQRILLNDCLRTQIAPRLTDEELAALKWQLQRAGVTDTQSLANWLQMLEDAQNKLEEATSAQKESFARETSKMSVPAVASYDPNEILVAPSGPDGWIRPFDRLQAVVRFENEGTGPAFDIRVEIPLPRQLDEGTLQLVGGSHLTYTVDPDLVDFLPPELHRHGNEFQETMKVSFDPERRVLTFYFPNIFLPPASCEDGGSPDCNDGFVIFSIAPRAPFSHGDEVSLFADIYFDLNSPVRTNTETRRVDSQGPVVGATADLGSDGRLAVRWNATDGGSGLQEIMISLWRQGELMPLAVQKLSPNEEVAYFRLPSSGVYRVLVQGTDRLGNEGPEFELSVSYRSRSNLSLSLSLEGNGTVIMEPGVIVCAFDCSAEFPPGTEVHLTANPVPGWTFARWSGDCSGTSTTTTVILDRDKGCTAHFTLEPPPLPPPTPPSIPAPRVPEGMALVEFGDVGCDAEVTAVDALFILMYVVGRGGEVPSRANCPALGQVVSIGDRPVVWGDINRDGQVDAVDALLVLRHVVGLPVAAPIGEPVIVVW